MMKRFLSANILAGFLGLTATATENTTELAKSLSKIASKIEQFGTGLYSKRNHEQIMNWLDKESNFKKLAVIWDRSQDEDYHDENKNDDLMLKEYINLASTACVGGKLTTEGW